MSKEKEACNFSSADTKIEKLRNSIITVIHEYRTKWKTEKANKYVQIDGKTCPLGKFCKLLYKNERYILNCLEIHWSRIEDKLDTSNENYQETDEFSDLNAILRDIEQQLNVCENFESEAGKSGYVNDNSSAEKTFQYSVDDICFRDGDFNLNLRLNDKETLSVSKSLCDPEAINSLRNFCVFVNCDMSDDDMMTTQLNSLCSVDLMFHNKNMLQTNKLKVKNLQLPPFNENPSAKNLQLPPFNQNPSAMKMIDKSFKDLDNIDTMNITSPTAIPLQNNQICYINFSKLWKESRWSAVKKKLIQRGVIESNGMYVVIPIYRDEFIIGKGNFGVVEFGLSRTYHGIALKRLTENGFCINRYDEIQSTLNQFSELTCENIHKSVAFQDCGGYGFISSRMCEYNLSEYIHHVKNNSNEWNIGRKKSILQQIINGLMALHLNNPIMIHGNLKPSNVLIDENGIVKLAEFGLFKFLYDNESQVNEADKIWRPYEVDSLAKKCNSISDIYSLGCLVLFIYSNGVVPHGNSKRNEIFKNEIHDIDLELNQLVTQMLENDAVLRPTVSEICKHIYFWPKERKWQFLLTSISMISHETTEYLGQHQQYTLSRYLEIVWNYQNVKTYWISSLFMNLPCTAISKGARHDSPIDLLKFLVKSQLEYPYLFYEPSVVLQTYPDLPFLIYSALKFKEQMAWETFPNLRSFLV